MSKELQVNKIQVPEVLVNEFKKLGITDDEASSLMVTFGVPLVEAGKILDTYQEIVVTDESQTDLMASARDKRRTLQKIRTGVENTRVELKAEHLRKGNAIQAVANYIKEEITPAEDYLKLQEKFAEIKQAERAAKIKSERVEKLMQYTDDISMYNIDNLEDETFEFLLSKVKKEHDDKIASEKAEADRLAKEEADRKAEQERIIAENERLRKEADEREKAIEAERIKQAKEQAKIDAERQKELDAERAKREVIEAEQRAKEQAELKAKQEAEEAERKALLSPDKDKLINFSNALEIIRKEKLPAVKTKQAQDVVNLIEEMLVKMQKIITEKAEEL